MATGSTDPTTSTWIYGEDDVNPNASGMLNRLAISVRDALSGILRRIRDGEAGVPLGTSWDTTAVPFYGRTATVVLPVVLTTDETLQVSISSTTAFATVSLAAISVRGASSTTVQVRLMQFGNANHVAHSFVWRVIKK